MCEELRKQKVDVCCLHEVRWRGEGARVFGVKGKRYKLWWSRKDDKTGGVGILVVSEKDRGKLWKEHMKKIMNVENEWDQMVEANMVEGPVEGVTHEEVMEATNKMKLGKAAGPSEVNMDMIKASGTFGVGVMNKPCQRVLDGKGMPKE